jgi:hypothetical protein
MTIFQTGFNPISISKRASVSNYLYEVQQSCVGNGENEAGRIIAALCAKHRLGLPANFKTNNNDIVHVSKAYGNK